METNTNPTSTSDTAASSIANLFINEINKQDINGLLQVQNSLLEQLDKTSEKLDGINKISAQRYLDATRDFANHTQMLTTMKTDLDLIFKQIKLLKMRLNKKYPEAYTSVIRMNANQHDSLDDEEEDDTLASSMKSSLVKSKTVDCSQLSSSMRETYSLAQISNNNTEQTPSSFDAVRRLLDKSPGGQDLTTLFKNARNELRKLNEGFLGGNSQKQSTSHEE